MDRQNVTSPNSSFAMKLRNMKSTRTPHSFLSVAGAIALLLAMTSTTFAQSEVPGPKQQGPIALVKATIYPVSSKVIEKRHDCFCRWKDHRDWKRSGHS